MSWMSFFLGFLPTFLAETGKVAEITIPQYLLNLNKDINVEFEDSEENEVIIDLEKFYLDDKASGTKNIKSISFEKRNVRYNSNNKRKSFVMTALTNGEKPTKTTRGVRWYHKGFYIGEFLDFFMKDNQKITFKNLISYDRFGYDLSQPDCLIAVLFMCVFKIKFTDLVLNYTDPNWFVAISTVGSFQITEEKDIKRFKRLITNKKGRQILNKEYFLRNKKYEESILMFCHNFLIESMSALGENGFAKIWETPLEELIAMNRFTNI